MTDSEEIHWSMTNAVNSEEIQVRQNITIGDVFRSLVFHPLQLISRWNWKAALLGALLRASFYLTVYKASRESWLVTLTAVTVEIAFRFATSGISGSVMQSFRRAQPAWLATLIVSISLPVFGHLVEFITHFAQEHYFANVFAASENNARQKAFAISVLISILSSLFNLFAMRDGVLLVGAGEETKSLWGDVKRLPPLVIEFIAFLPLKILSSLRERKLISAFAMFIGFGLSVGFILGVFRGKWVWAWTTTLGAWALLIFTTLIVAFVKRILDQRKRNSEIFYLAPESIALAEKLK